jgi:hypothetical protein
MYPIVRRDLLNRLLSLDRLQRAIRAFISALKLRRCFDFIGLSVSEAAILHLIHWSEFWGAPQNYLEHIANHAAQVRGFINDNYGLELKLVSPRGFIPAGNSVEFSTQEQRDDFRQLSHGLKNVMVWLNVQFRQI